MSQFLAFRATRAREGTLVESTELKSILEVKQGAVCLPVDRACMDLSGVGGYHSRNFFGVQTAHASTLGSLVLFADSRVKRLHYAIDVEVIDERTFSAWFKPIVAAKAGNHVAANLRLLPGAEFQPLPPCEEVADRPGEIKRSSVRRMIGMGDLFMNAEGYFEVALYGMTAGSRLIWAGATVSG